MTPSREERQLHPAAVGAEALSAAAAASRCRSLVARARRHRTSVTARADVRRCVGSRRSPSPSRSCSGRRRAGSSRRTRSACARGVVSERIVSRSRYDRVQAIDTRPRPGPAAVRRRRAARAVRRRRRAGRDRPQGGRPRTTPSRARRPSGGRDVPDPLGRPERRASPEPRRGPAPPPVLGDRGRSGCGRCSSPRSRPGSLGVLVPVVGAARRRCSTTCSGSRTPNGCCPTRVGEAARDRRRRARRRVARCRSSGRSSRSPASASTREERAAAHPARGARAARGVGARRARARRARRSSRRCASRSASRRCASRPPATPRRPRPRRRCCRSSGRREAEAVLRLLLPELDAALDALEHVPSRAAAPLRPAAAGDRDRRRRRRSSRSPAPARSRALALLPLAALSRLGPATAPPASRCAATTSSLRARSRTFARTTVRAPTRGACRPSGASETPFQRRGAPRDTRGRRLVGPAPARRPRRRSDAPPRCSAASRRAATSPPG